MARDNNVPRRTARRIVREVVRRGLVPGEALSSEAALLEWLGVARGSLRESLRLLAFLGAIDSRPGPGGGTRVAEPSPQVVTGPLAMVAQGRRTPVGQIVDALAGLAPVVAEGAALNREDHDLDLMQRCLDDLQSATDSASFERAHDRFYRAVAEAAGNDLLAVMFQALLALFASRSWDYNDRIRRLLTSQKQAIAVAIEAGHGAEASKLAGEDFTRGIRWLKRQHADELAECITWPEVDRFLERETSGQLRKET